MWADGRTNRHDELTWEVFMVTPCINDIKASQVILCSHNTDNACTAIYVPTWTKCVILAKRWLAPWWWFPCKSKHVGAAFLILICFNKLYKCISWTRKGLIPWEDYIPFWGDILRILNGWKWLIILCKATCGKSADRISYSATTPLRSTLN